MLNDVQFKNTQIPVKYPDPEVTAPGRSFQPMTLPPTRLAKSSEKNQVLYREKNNKLLKLREKLGNREKKRIIDSQTGISYDFNEENIAFEIGKKTLICN